MKLNPYALANSLSAITAIFYAGFWILKLISPEAYKVTFNAQFFGADVASLDRGSGDLINVFATFLLLVVGSWVAGYIWAELYNKWAK